MATQLVKGNTAVIIGAMYAGCETVCPGPLIPVRNNFVQHTLYEVIRYMAHLTGANANSLVVFAVDDGVGLHILGNTPGE